MPLMSAGASVAVVPATLCRFEPFVVIAVKLFHNDSFMVIVQIRAKKNRPESGRFCFLAETVGFD
ncbi:hypothetical protein [Neisseria meningitidis]|uniref:hypothetical protein n=1 Tax=Neisseria meningitidis TaxID=487 RepID=UPI002B1E740A|nr:hypothetical protein [Neisseria meningitidis]